MDSQISSSSTRQADVAGTKAGSAPTAPNLAAAQIPDGGVRASPPNHKPSLVQEAIDLAQLTELPSSNRELLELCKRLAAGKDQLAASAQNFFASRYSGEDLSQAVDNLRRAVNFGHESASQAIRRLPESLAKVATKLRALVAVSENAKVTFDANKRNNLLEEINGEKPFTERKMQEHVKQLLEVWGFSSNAPRSADQNSRRYAHWKSDPPEVASELVRYSNLVSNTRFSAEGAKERVANALEYLNQLEELMRPIGEATRNIHGENHDAYCDCVAVLDKRGTLKSSKFKPYRVIKSLLKKHQALKDNRDFVTGIEKIGDALNSTLHILDELGNKEVAKEAARKEAKLQAEADLQIRNDPLKDLTVNQATKAYGRLNDTERAMVLSKVIAMNNGTRGLMRGILYAFRTRADDDPQAFAKRLIPSLCALELKEATDAFKGFDKAETAVPEGQGARLARLLLFEVAAKNLVDESASGSIQLIISKSCTELGLSNWIRERISSGLDEYGKAASGNSLDLANLLVALSAACSGLESSSTAG